MRICACDGMYSEGERASNNKRKCVQARASDRTRPSMRVAQASDTLRSHHITLGLNGDLSIMPHRSVTIEIEMSMTQPARGAFAGNSRDYPHKENVQVFCCTSRRCFQFRHLRLITRLRSSESERRRMKINTSKPARALLSDSITERIALLFFFTHGIVRSCIIDCLRDDIKCY